MAMESGFNAGVFGVKIKFHKIIALLFLNISHIFLLKKKSFKILFFVKSKKGIVF